jgi:hypothetical protein
MFGGRIGVTELIIIFFVVLVVTGTIAGAVALGIRAALTAKQKTDNGGARAQVTAASTAPLSTERRTEHNQNSQANRGPSRFCTKCGERIAVDSTFCGACGARIA